MAALCVQPKGAFRSFLVVEEPTKLYWTYLHNRGIELGRMPQNTADLAVVRFACGLAALQPRASNFQLLLCPDIKDALGVLSNRDCPITVAAVLLTDSMLLAFIGTAVTQMGQSSIFLLRSGLCRAQSPKAPRDLQMLSDSCCVEVQYGIGV